MKFVLPLLFTIVFIANSFAQPMNTSVQTNRVMLHLKKTNTTLKIDGIPDEPDWQQAEIATGFWKKFPTDDGPATKNTETKTLYNDQFLYISFTVYDTTKAFISTLKRDGGHDGNDAVAIILDPQNEKTNGFVFVVNAFNAQSDDQLSPGNNSEWSWDQKWFSATKRYKDHWTAEVAIPFKTLRYSVEKTIWAINFVRVDAKGNEYDVWSKVPVNFRSFDLGYTGQLIWDQAPPAPGTNVVLIPYATSNVVANQQEGKPTSVKANAGFDAKVALNSAMNLDLTVNPDFAQVEVDRQVTNLTRFNIFFPERRNFFLENADLYSTYGIDPIRPFYSRRIGLDRNGNKIPILGGARLTGNLTKTTRIGLMNMQTGRKDDYSPENYTAVSVNQKILKRSVVRGYFLNRQAFLSESEKQKDPLLLFGRNAGVQFDFSDEKGKWSSWTGFHTSFKPGIKGENKYLSVGGSYNVRNFEITTDISSVGTNYYTDMGFLERIENYDALRDTVIRKGYTHFFTSSKYRFYPKAGKVNQQSFTVETFHVLNPDGSFNEYNTSFNANTQFRNTAVLVVSYGYSDIHLQYPISFTGGTPLPAGIYKNHQPFIGYYSDYRKPFAFGIGTGTGSFFSGTNTKVEAYINYRHIPHLNIAINFNYYHLNFPGTYGNAELFLISPRVEFNFNTKMFWTTFLQYNTQGNNFNINSRFQWRYRPMSDLFVVYTDNYYTDPLFKNKNRAVVMKFTYWLNL
ncbi:MAG: DUF5916 domain-containing protein [Chitinophagaceae bacterium]